MLSTYLAPTVEVAATMIASTQWEWFGTARLGAVRDRGFEVHATTCEVWDEAAGLWIPEDPLQGDHADVLVGIYPADQPRYDHRPPKAVREQLRARFDDRYTEAAEMFHPRQRLTPAHIPSE